MSTPWHSDIPALTAAREVIAATVTRWMTGAEPEDEAAQDGE